MARFIAVAPSDAQAREIAMKGARQTVASMRGATRRSYSNKIHLASAEEKSRDLRSPEERYVQDTIIHGSPSRVAEIIRELQETIGLHYLLCVPFSHGSFLSFTEEVIPKLV